MKYTEADITRIRIKINSGDYSASWYRNQFKSMLNHIEKLNQKEAKNGNTLETSKQT